MLSKGWGVPSIAIWFPFDENNSSMACFQTQNTTLLPYKMRNFMRQRLVNLYETGFYRKTKIEICSTSNEPLTIFSLTFLSLFEKDTNYTDHRLSTVMERAIGTIMGIQFVFVSILSESIDSCDLTAYG